MQLVSCLWLYDCCCCWRWWWWPMKIVLINRKQQLRWIVEHALCSLDYIIVDEAASGQSALSAQIRHRSHSIRDDAMQRQQQQQKPKIENWSHDGSLPGTTRKIVAFIRLPVPPHRPLSVCVTSSNTLSLTEKWLETFYDSVSEWVSSFLTAHQHIKGYFVPSRLLWK